MSMLDPMRKGPTPELERNGRNRYSSIAADLAQRISSGEWPIGRTLPSYRELANSYRVGAKLIRLAINQLIRDGHVAPRKRRPPLIALSAPISSTLDRSIAVVIDAGYGTELGEYRIAMIRGMISSSINRSPLILLHHN